MPSSDSITAQHKGGGFRDAGVTRQLERVVNTLPVALAGKRTRDLAIVPPLGMTCQYIPKALFALCQWRHINWSRGGLHGCLQDRRDEGRRLVLHTCVLIILLRGGSQCRRMPFELPLQGVAQVAK